MLHCAKCGKAIKFSETIYLSDAEICQSCARQFGMIIPGNYSKFSLEDAVNGNIKKPHTGVSGWGIFFTVLGYLSVIAGIFTLIASKTSSFLVHTTAVAYIISGASLVAVGSLFGFIKHIMRTQEQHTDLFFSILARISHLHEELHGDAGDKTENGDPTDE